MGTEELKPCPFCGSNAMVDEFKVSNNCFMYHVRCTKCNVDFNETYSTKLEAIKHWNTRKSNKLSVPCDGCNNNIIEPNFNRCNECSRNYVDLYKR